MSPEICRACLRSRNYGCFCKVVNHLDGSGKLRRKRCIAAAAGNSLCHKAACAVLHQIERRADLQIVVFKDFRLVFVLLAGAAAHAKTNRPEHPPSEGCDPVVTLLDDKPIVVTQKCHAVRLEGVGHGFVIALVVKSFKSCHCFFPPFIFRHRRRPAGSSSAPSRMRCACPPQRSLQRCRRTYI